MWTSTLELDPAHVLLTKILGRFWRGAYFSSFAPFKVQNLPRQPLPASNWVRVRNSLAGICGSDLHLIFAEGDFSIAPAALPNHGHTYPGHEVVGEVIEVGDDVQHLRVGERVVLQHGPNCLTSAIQPPCRSCTAGNYGLCEYAASHSLQPIGGGWSEEMLLHEQQLFRIPPEISDAQAVLIEPSAVALHAVLRCLPQPGERVLIIGAGTIGLLMLQVVRALVPEAEVHVLARHTFQVERATRLGAAQIIYPRNSYQQVQLATGAELYHGAWDNTMLMGGYDVIYDTVGNTRTTHDSLRWARAGGTVVMVGLNLHHMHIDLTPIWYQEINLVGTMGNGLEIWPIGTSERKSTFAIAVEMIEQGQLQPEKLITHSYPLSEYRHALLTASDKARNHAIKVVFDYSKQPPSVVPNVRASAHQRQRALTTVAIPLLSQPLIPQEPSYPQGDRQSPPEIRPEPEPEKTPVPSATEPSVAYITDTDDDFKTAIVSPPSKRTRRFGAGSQFIQPQHITRTDEEAKAQTVSPAKHARFDIASQYGSLPGFHQGLDKIGLPLLPSDNDGDETSKTNAVSPPQTVQHAVSASTDDVGESAHLQEEWQTQLHSINENIAVAHDISPDEPLPASYIPSQDDSVPDMLHMYADPENDYTWTQFTPAHLEQSPETNGPSNALEDIETLESNDTTDQPSALPVPNTQEKSPLPKSNLPRHKRKIK